MFESNLMLKTARSAMGEGRLDEEYQACWAGLKKKFSS